jgi:hypothetical protein
VFYHLHVITHFATLQMLLPRYQEGYPSWIGLPQLPGFPDIDQPLFPWIEGFPESDLFNGIENSILSFQNARALDEPLGQVNPNDIRFSQNSIRSVFSNDETLDDTINGLINGIISPSDFPPIRIFEVDGNIFTLDNRRLYVFQEAGFPINTMLATPFEIENESWKFTTENDGTSIQVRGQN